MYHSFLIVGALFASLFILAYYHKKKEIAFYTKVMASACFVFAGWYFYLTMPVKENALFVIVGLICGFLGDLFLDLKSILPKYKNKFFVIGSCTFLCGHIMYIIYNCFGMVRNFAITEATIEVIVGILGIAVIQWLQEKCESPKKLVLFGELYLLIIDLSFGISLVSMKEHGILMMIGTLLFMVSDHLLVYDYFGKKKFPSFHGILLVLYYAAQWAIVYSILGV